MKQYYESEVLFQLMERDGLIIPSSVPPYESEIKAYLINQVKQAYPKLTDYEAEWLLYNYTKHLPAEFPISSVSDVTEATFENVVPFAYQSAILKGKTDENLQSVKMPVLKIVGKNLFNINIFKNECDLDEFPYKKWKMQLKPNTTYIVNSSFTKPNNDETGYDSYATIINGSNYIDFIYHWNLNIGLFNTIFTTDDTGVIYLGWYKGTCPYNIWDIVEMQIEEGSTATSYEPYKSNILTVNEDVTLRSNGTVHDELDLLTGKLTQRIDEDNEVLAQEVVKTVDLTTINEKGETTYFMPLEGTMSVQSSGEIIKPTFDMSVPIEAITQNLASFIDLEMEE